MPSKQVVRDFTGSNEDVAHWCRHLQMEAALENWNDQQLLYKACSRLTGAAAVWLDTHTLSTWADFRQALISRFAEQPEAIANRLFRCKQSSRECTAAFADRFQHLAAKLDITQNQLPQSLLVRLFIDGLQSDIGMQVIVKHPSSVEQAIAEAKYLEEFQEQTPVFTAHMMPKRTEPLGVPYDRAVQDYPLHRHNRHQHQQHWPRTLAKDATWA